MNNPLVLSPGDAIPVITTPVEVELNDFEQISFSDEWVAYLFDHPQVKEIRLEETLLQIKLTDLIEQHRRRKISSETMLVVLEEVENQISETLPDLIDLSSLDVDDGIMTHLLRWVSEQSYDQSYPSTLDLRNNSRFEGEFIGDCNEEDFGKFSSIYLKGTNVSLHTLIVIWIMSKGPKGDIRDLILSNTEYIKFDTADYSMCSAFTTIENEEIMDLFREIMELRGVSYGLTLHRDLWKFFKPSQFPNLIYLDADDLWSDDSEETTLDEFLLEVVNSFIPQLSWVFTEDDFLLPKLIERVEKGNLTIDEIPSDYEPTNEQMKFLVRLLTRDQRTRPLCVK